MIICSLSFGKNFGKGAKSYFNGQRKELSLLLFAIYDQQAICLKRRRSKKADSSPMRLSFSKIPLSFGSKKLTQLICWLPRMGNLEENADKLGAGLGWARYLPGSLTSLIDGAFEYAKRGRFITVLQFFHPLPNPLLWERVFRIFRTSEFFVCERVYYPPAEPKLFPEN